MDESTTDATVQEQAPVEAQPEEQHAEAEIQPTSEPTTTDEQPAEEPATETTGADNSKDDFDFEAWLEKKGIDPATPEGKAAIAKSWRELEQKMHQTTQRTSELEKALQSTPAEQQSTDPAVQQALETAAAVKLELEVERWKQQNKITPQQDEAIGDYLTQNPNKAYMLKNGYLTLDDIAAMSGALNQSTEDVKTQASREALESLANQQRASAPKASASTQTPVETDPILEELLKD